MARTTPGFRNEPRDRRARWAVFCAAALALVFFAGTILAPALDRAGSPWGGMVRLVYAPACHQLPERSLTLAGSAQAVCARCAGLYLGGMAGLALSGLLLAGTRRRVPPMWLAAALAPTAFDALLPWLSLPQLPGLPRFLLAIPAGGVAALFLAEGLADLFSSARETRHPVSLTPHASPVLEEVDG